MYLFRRLGFFFISEIRVGRYASSDGSMESMVIWIGLFLLGPTTLWLAVLLSTLDFVRNWNRFISKVDRWSRLRNYTFYLTSSTLIYLVAYHLYLRWGGMPLPGGLGLDFIVPAFAAVVTYFVLVLVVWSGYILYSIWTQMVLTQSGNVQPVIRFMLISLGLPSLAHPFAILSAGLYVQNGILTFLFFIIGLVLVAALTRQLSWVAESNRQRSRQLERLEELGRSIINAPPDASTLPGLLREHVPTMFPPGRVLIWMSPDQVLARYPEDWSVDLGSLVEWLSESSQVASFLVDDRLPWAGDSQAHNAVVVAPVLDVDSNTPRGGIYLELYSLSQPWDTVSLASLYPGVLSLSAYVASAFHQAEIYTQALAYQRVSEELSLAGRIQASFLPDELPKLSGWQLAVTLLPARETSGDFFDLIPLSDGRMGILVADVADKGVGAALYMALCRTLIRTYAIEFDDEPHPELVLFAANGRILRDARANLFVTTFYSILDPKTGVLTYSNAGHNPPLLLKAQGEKSIYLLGQTGMPVGVEEEQVWGVETVQIQPGDVLILYTDGIPDALNPHGDFFQDKRLIEMALSSQGLTANEIQEVILKGLGQFVGNAPQFDDITLMVLVRDTL
jgi:serine phosphatase RsbU (regulator of sigma subunit)